MDFIELAKTRFSVRSYASTPVPAELVDKVIEAGRLAPSAANRQPWRFVVVQSERQRQALGEGYSREWFWRAPVIIVVCVEPGRAWVRSDGKNYADVDGAIALDHMTLCAAAEGLGTCWIAAFDVEKVRRVLGLPAGIDPLAMTPLGYSKDTARAKSRKAVGEVVWHEQWGNP